MSENFPEIQNEWLKDNFFGMHSVIEGLIGKGERWDVSLAKEVTYLHDGVQRKNEEGNLIPDTGQPPKVLFVTATSAIPYAIAIKECWKTAYPNEKPPKFFFVDVSERRFGLDNYYKRILTDEEIDLISLAQVEKLRKIGRKHDAFDNSAVFDEFTNFGTTLREVDRQLQQAGFSNVNFMYGWWGHPKPESGIIDSIRPVVRKGDNILGLESGATSYRRLAVQINKDSKDLVKDFKNIGRAMGHELLHHIHPSHVRGGLA